MFLQNCLRLEQHRRFHRGVSDDPSQLHIYAASDRGMNALWNFQWCICAVEELDCREDKICVTYVFEIMDHILSLRICVMPRIARLIAHISHLAVAIVRSPLAGIQRSPEIVKDVCVETYAVPWLQNQMPNSDAVGL